MHIAGMLSPGEFWARQSEMDDRVRALFLRRPCFGLVGWSGSRMIDEWSFGSGSLRSLRFDLADATQVVVATSDSGEEGPAQHLLLNLPTGGTGHPDDEDRLNAHFDNARRPPSGSITIPVAGVPVDFDTWTSERFTVAGATIGDLSVALRWNGPLSPGLELVQDVEPYLDGRRNHIRSLRRGHDLDS
jgi:hypothetical protein